MFGLLNTLSIARFRELGSARQVLLSMQADQIHFPRPSDEGRMTSFVWMPIRYPQRDRDSEKSLLCWPLRLREK